MPAEWEPHRATWLAWPHNAETWPDKLSAMPPLWHRLVNVLCEYEPVHILAGAASCAEEARATLGDLPDVSIHNITVHDITIHNITIHNIATNDCWIRDFGPTFVVSPDEPNAAMVDWRYDAWGGKYPPFEDDAQATLRMSELANARRFTPNVVLEGGAIDSNGLGAMLATESCLLHAGRNPGLSRPDVERLFHDYLGATHVVWLSGELAGDDTDGHVDQMARFVGPTTVVAAVEQDPQDVNYGPLRDNIERLSRATDQRGQSLEVVELPMPEACFHRGSRLPASYANFYIANGVVIVPAFGAATDDLAVDILRGVFPQRKIVSLPAFDLITGLGAFHCLTLNEPKGRSRDLS